MKRKAFIFVVLILTTFVTACRDDEKELRDTYQQYPFDSTVIAKLPLYDSLVISINQHADFFQKYINKDNKHSYFSYRPFMFNGVTDSLPDELIDVIKHYYEQLGEGYFDGFDVFKDSSIKFYIRREPLGNNVEAIENLSYNPDTAQFQKRKFPAKDTLLNDHWQYWIYIFKSGFPF